MSPTMYVKRGLAYLGRAVELGWQQRSGVACAGALALLSACGSDEADPNLLSSRGLYANIDRRTMVSGAVEYEPDYPLWSDGAQKRRWLILPPGQNIDTSDMAHWRFPVGTKLFKEFSVRGKLIETRLVERVSNTGSVKRDFFMGTFVWNKNQSDAVLTTDGVTDALGTEHDVPEQTACVQCHRGEPSAVLGVSAVQLSRSGTIDEFADAGRLSVKPERRFLIPGNQIESVAIGYMNANCGHCHSSDGIADVMRLRFLPSESDGPLEQTEIYKTTIRRKITDWKVHPDELQQRVIPGDPEHSGLLYRMQQRGTEAPASDDAMPPIATERVHPEGLAAVEAWIATMPRDLEVPEDPTLTTRETPKHDEHETMPEAQAGRGAQDMPHDQAGAAAPSGEPEMKHGAAGSKAPGGSTEDHPAPKGNDGAGGQANARLEGGAGASGGGGAGAPGSAGMGAAGAAGPAAGAGGDAAGSGAAGNGEPAAGSGSGGAGAGAAGSGVEPAAGSGAAGTAAGSGAAAGSGGDSAGSAGAGASQGRGGAGGAAGVDDDDDGHDEHAHTP